MDVDKAETEMKEQDYAVFKENAELKAIIAGSKAKTSSITMGDIVIKIRPTVPKGVRDRISKIASAYHNGEITQADDEMYLVMAEICLDEPYTNPAMWKYLDEETGETPNILGKIVEKITEKEQSATRFRPK